MHGESRAPRVELSSKVSLQTICTALRAEVLAFTLDLMQHNYLDSQTCGASRVMHP